jgi:Heterokaryon incompatibility protein (HET)
MRLLQLGSHGELSLTKDFVNDIPLYAILSHTWSVDEDEVTFHDLETGSGTSKAGYTKLQFCGKQAKKDGLEYFWVDTCCINQTNHAELSEAVASMFRWYRDSQFCYVYLSDVSISNASNNQHQQTWEPAFRKSRWFTRGWTLQELIAPRFVKFFSQEESLLGDKKMLQLEIQEITGVPVTALSGSPLTQFSIEERLRWAAKRSTKRKEDQAYSLLGIFDIFIPLIYGEGDHAFVRLREEIDKRSGMMTTDVTVFRPGRGLPVSSSVSIQDLVDDIRLRLEMIEFKARHNDVQPQQCVDPILERFLAAQQLTQAGSTPSQSDAVSNIVPPPYALSDVGAHDCMGSRYVREAADEEREAAEENVKVEHSRLTKKLLNLVPVRWSSQHQASVGRLARSDGLIKLLREWRVSRFPDSADLDDSGDWIVLPRPGE